VDLATCEEPEVSGIAGTGFSALFSYQVARHLARVHPAEVSIDWDGYAHHARLGSALPRFIPLLEEDAMVEAHPPYLAWLNAAEGGEHRALPWLLENIERLPGTFEEKAGLFDSLELYLRWNLAGSRAARTHTRIAAPEPFYHRSPLIRRAEVSLEREFAAPDIPVRKLPAREAAKLLNLARDTSATRYRELHGFTHGGAGHVWEADLGRGVRVFVCGVAPARRLPLRAYHAGMFFKNGVPSGYVEGISFAERMEIGFNLYYTFREGESAWLYARTLRLFHQELGLMCFSVDPYQIGDENEEAIESGAIWFYRKLGFRPVRPEITRLMEREERRIRETPAYRTPASTLRRMAKGHLLYEAPGSEAGVWDRFTVSTLGLKAARRGAGETLLNVPGLARWSAEEEAAAGEIVRAKRGAEERDYLRLMQTHRRLRDAVARWGSSSMG
jgi:hypothetical protein